ncbi:MAG: cupin domain-containing protein [Rhizobiaceae bacterium]|nr:cupin domain-containing protein [Rhizobiaceae bacterium]
MAAHEAVRCVYTVLFGRYEGLNEQPVAAHSDIPFICFTDDPELRSKTWEIRLVEPRFAEDAVRSQRLLKILPHSVLPDFDTSLYVDNTVILKIVPEKLLETYPGASSIALFSHSFRTSLAHEFMAVQSSGRDDVARVQEQLEHYSRAHPNMMAQRPYWTGMLFRRHNDPDLLRMARLWRDHMLRYSRRDQLSLNLAFLQSGLCPQVIEADNHASWFHSWPHATERKDVAKPSQEGSWRTLAGRDNVAAGYLRARLEAAEAEVHALRSSTSWRITAPLRALVFKARNLGMKPLAENEAVPVPTAYRHRQVGSLPPLADVKADDFNREGYLGPQRLFTPEQCDLILRHHRSSPIRGSREWPKDLAIKDPFHHDLATRPSILGTLRALLGDEVVLWGASVVERRPGQVHRVHTDIESSSPDGGFVSVWVGLEGTSQHSALNVFSRSHRTGRSVQQEFHERGVSRDDATNETILGWVKEHEPAASFISPDMTDGDALFFDGRLWHGSANTGNESRAALLLQYARTGVTVPIQEFGASGWPFRMTGKHAPVLPVIAEGKALNLQAQLPLPSISRDGAGYVPGPKGFVPYHLLRGATPNVPDMESHVSVLDPGQSPHPPHAHVEEELLIVLDGEAEIVIPDPADQPQPRTERLTAGGVVYYPAYQFHTIRNVSQRPATYLMYKWRAAPKETSGQLGTTIFHIEDAKSAPSGAAQSLAVLLESPTGYLSRLHAHVTRMKPGGGYPAHSDGHDVAIIVFEGQVETLGTKLGPKGTAFSPAGEPHGLRNADGVEARYLVFEFEG